MARSTGDQEFVEQFHRFFRSHYDDDIAELAQHYPSERRSLYVDYDDLYRHDRELAEDLRARPDQVREYAEEALRQYDLPVDVKLGRAHVRLRNLPDTVDIRDIRVHDDHIGRLVAVQGIVRKATDVRPKITEAAFECQRCGTMTYIPQTDGSFQEPHECQGCERQGPFRVNFDQSEFVDSQKLRVQESPEGLRGGETPQAIDVNIEDDVTGKVTAGDHVTVTGVLHIEQMGGENDKSAVFDIYMDGVAVEVEDEQFEKMEITEEDKARIIDLKDDPDIYEKMVASVAPTIWGYEDEKLTIVFQLFSGVRKHLPDKSRIRGDLHILLIGDPGTGKCVAGDTRVTLADGSEAPIRDLVESNLDDPKPVDDGVWDEVDLELPTMTEDGELVTGRASKVWKREAPDRLFRIRTESGRRVEVTPTHPLFVARDGGADATVAEDLEPGQFVAVPRSRPPRGTDQSHGGARNPREERRRSTAGDGLAADGGVDAEPGAAPDSPRALAHDDIGWDRIESIEPVGPESEWVYDLEVEGTHNYLTNDVVSHNSQILQYVQKVAPRSIYTSGKGSSAAGLTAAAVRDDFSDGQQWTLEAGALVLADQGIAAVDELDKMAPDDRSAMHEALEQQQISISKAGINATLQSRCSLLGAANPKYGRFDQYEPVGEQIDLEPALISRFDLIFTVTDDPDPERDADLADHILQTNYAGELSTQRTEQANPNYSVDEVQEANRDVQPAIDPDLMRKYIAYAKRTCFPTMTDEARAAIRDFYVDMRARGADEDAPVPVTARKLEALVRLAEASARVRLADEVTAEDAERVIDLVRSSLEDIGVDPETGEFDADIIETGTSKSQRDRIKNLKSLIEDIESEYEDGAPVEEVLDRADEVGMDRTKVEDEIEKLKERGEVYEPRTQHLRTT